MVPFFPNHQKPTIDIYSPAGTQDTAATFDEHEALKAILRSGRACFEIQQVGEVHTHQTPSLVFSVLTASIGSADPMAPVVGFYGGIHGLERIGSQLVLDYMQSLLYRLQ